MRTLLPHSLRRLIPLVGFLVAVAGGGASCADSLPRPIGRLSDYGAVLDRHGRERIEARIDETQSRFGIDVYLLATWENPLSDATALAEALFRTWGLIERRATVLAVFVRTNGVWTHAVAETGDLAQHGLAKRLEAGVADLVAHRRIEEAMDALFHLVADRVEPIDTSPPTEEGSGSPPAKWPIVLAVLLVAAGLVWVIRRRVCPRCGRWLRIAKGPSVGSRSIGANRVYYCRTCGLRRGGRRPPGAPR